MNLVVIPFTPDAALRGYIGWVTISVYGVLPLANVRHFSWNRLVNRGNHGYFTPALCRS